MQQPAATTIDDLTEDARFEVIKNLDYQSIDSLCSTNRLFRRFCVSFEGNIYKYLLQRDYGIDSPRDVARQQYLQARGVQNLVLKKLREGGLNIFADMLELECLLKPKGRIHQLFTSPACRVIIAPLDTRISQYIDSVRYLSEDDFYEQFDTLFLENHVGAFNQRQKQSDDLKFSNLNGLTFQVATSDIPLVAVGNIAGLQLYTTNQVILSPEQHATILAFFDEQRDYDAAAIWP